MPKRQLTDSEKQQAIEMQRQKDGSLRCFISGEIINLKTDEYEFDHVEAWSKDGETTLDNIRLTLKKYNRRKSDQSLYEVRDNLRLERLFEKKRNSIKLQDILELKNIKIKSLHANLNDESVVITDGIDSKRFALFSDPILGVSYFYGRIPLQWLQNDDQEGLQPRVIDYKRLITLRDHLKSHPQMAPAIARLIPENGSIRLFDGQHKVAAQILNSVSEIDIKIFVSPKDAAEAKKLFDSLMITNLEAHSKLRQVPFYTSTLLERLSVIYRELWDDFATSKPPAEHSEANFIKFLIVEKNFTRVKAQEVFRAAVKENSLADTAIVPFVAEASKDPSYPITQEMLNIAIYPACLYLEASTALFDTEFDYRNQEVANFKHLCELIVERSYLKDWTQRQGAVAISDLQRKARRIWHKASVVTWSLYLKDIIINAFNMMTDEERSRLLYRLEMTSDVKERINACLKRLFDHNFWNAPEGEIDNLLASATKQSDLFKRNGLTPLFVLTGSTQ